MWFAADRHRHRHGVYTRRVVSRTYADENSDWDKNSERGDFVRV